VASTLVCSFRETSLRVLTTLKEFELGLELDSPDVRGILLYNQQEWGRFVIIIFLDKDKVRLTCMHRVTFDFEV